MAKEYLVNLNNYTEDQSYFSMPRMRPKTTDERVAKRDRSIEDLRTELKMKKDELVRKDELLTEYLVKFKKANQEVINLMNEKIGLLEEIDKLKIASYKDHKKGPPPPFNPDAVTVNRDALPLGPDAEGE